VCRRPRGFRRGPSLQVIHPLARRTDRPDAYAIILSGTGMPVLGAIEPLERDLKKPVVAATAAMLWKSLHVAGIRGAINHFGRLLC
jgi:maleate cis-trans isomerase